MIKERFTSTHNSQGAKNKAAEAEDIRFQQELRAAKESNNPKWYQTVLKEQRTALEKRYREVERAKTEELNSLSRRIDELNMLLWELFHIDEQGAKWDTALQIAKQLGIGDTFVYDTAKKKGLETKRIKYPQTHREVNLYRLDDIKEQLKEFLQLPLIPENGYYTDEQDSIWVTSKAIETHFPLIVELKKVFRCSTHQLLSSPNIREKKGRIKTGQIVKLFNLGDVEIEYGKKFRETDRDILADRIKKLKEKTETMPSEKTPEDEGE
jgi:hypothetical protein